MHHMKSSPPPSVAKLLQGCFLLFKGKYRHGTRVLSDVLRPTARPRRDQSTAVPWDSLHSLEGLLRAISSKRERERETKIRTFKHTQNVTSI